MKFSAYLRPSWSFVIACILHARSCVSYSFRSYTSMSASCNEVFLTSWLFASVTPAVYKIFSPKTTDSNSSFIVYSKLQSWPEDTFRGHVTGNLLKEQELFERHLKPLQMVRREKIENTQVQGENCAQAEDLYRTWERSSGGSKTGPASGLPTRDPQRIEADTRKLARL